ncbi:hypothetical protein [Kaistella jeonii]|uniref:PsbP C-terminal domain-containing protein n=1 Tax=Kaistella jeonii TaxID=266749 RepID=A0A0C1EYM5_9FLAO|nr:hypothetical protein [Kaistella jeonii]KIA85952.1 hypothetical protein OA86_14515 [Kaistella jeonii]SFC39943.1 hypothetical protein SAMN05421876_11831 [Kaistella jeonii]VEI95478.1 Uncharacterised protein [Kaistella jeonii]
MIKKIFLLLFIASLGFIKAQENVVDLISVPGPIDLDGTEFLLSWSKQPSKTLYRQQFLPRDEQIENFTQLLDFSFFNKEIDIELAVRQKVESIQSRAEKDKFAKVNVSESPDGKEYIVDYFISEAPSKGDSYVEYNVYRFKQFDTGTQKSFLILSYAKRSYGDLKSAAKSLGKERDRLMTNMIEYKIPEIKVAALPAGK